MKKRKTVQNFQNALMFPKTKAEWHRQEVYILRDICSLVLMSNLSPISHVILSDV